MPQPCHSNTVKLAYCADTLIKSTQTHQALLLVELENMESSSVVLVRGHTHASL